MSDIKLSKKSLDQLSLLYECNSKATNPQVFDEQNAKVLFYKSKYINDRSNVFFDLIKNMMSDSGNRMKFRDNDWIIITDSTEMVCYWNDKISSFISKYPEFFDVFNCISIYDKYDIFSYDSFNNNTANILLDIVDEIDFSEYQEYLSVIDVDSCELLFMFNEDSFIYYEPFKFLFNHLSFITLNPIDGDNQTGYEFVSDSFNISILELPYKALHSKLNFRYFNKDSTSPVRSTDFMYLKTIRSNINNLNIFKKFNLDVTCNEIEYSALIDQRLLLHKHIISTTKNESIKTYYKKMSNNLIKERRIFNNKCKYESALETIDTATSFYKTILFTDDLEALKEDSLYCKNQLFNFEFNLWKATTSNNLIILNDHKDIDYKLYSKAELVFIANINTNTKNLVDKLLLQNPKLKIILLINPGNKIDRKIISILKKYKTKINSYGRKNINNLFG